MSTATATTNTVTFDPNSVSKQADVLYPVTALQAGLMTPDMLARLPVVPVTVGVALAVYSNDGVGAPIRPDANLIGATAEQAIMIWNVDDKAPNFSGSIDGGLTFLWYDADGNET